jgi:hypothetical protein
MPRFTLKRLFIATALVTTGCGALYITGELLVTRIPPRSNTVGTMHMMKRRILRYASAHNAAPTSVDQLPLIEGYWNDVVDAWNRPILLKIEGNEATLTSYGRDGRAGGVGDDADMTGVFLMKNDSGQWAGEFDEWQIDPYFEQ